MKDPCVQKEVVNALDRNTYLKVKELPQYEESDSEDPGCTMCAGLRDTALCHNFPGCGSNGTGSIYIRPEDLEKYKVAYTIARIG